VDRADDVGLFDQVSISNGGPACVGLTVAPDQPFPLPQSCLIPYLNTLANQLDFPPLQSARITPLAQAYCRAVTFLKNLTVADPSATLDVVLVSDGGQVVDKIDPATTCHGPDSAKLPATPDFPSLPYFVQDDNGTFFVATSPIDFNAQFLTVGSWQANMLDVAISGGLPGSGPAVGLGMPNLGPHLIPASGTTIPGAFQPGGASQCGPNKDQPCTVLTNVDFIKDFVPSMAAAPMARSLAAASAPADPFPTFLDGLARATGGRLVIPSNTTANGDPFGTHALTGDINDSGCVDATDFNLLQQAFGQKATVFNPQALAADLSLDGTVNDRDYAVLKAKYGSGCATSPGTIPVLAKVVLGFGDATNWIPTLATTPLTLTAAAKTEGTTGLKVGGTNFREIRSVPFNTSVFGTVPSTAKMMADLFIPGPPSNPSWLGQAQLLINCPSAGINNQYIGAVELTGKPLNRFSPISFSLPANVRAAINAPRADFSIKLVVNSADSGQVWDNLRVTP